MHPDQRCINRIPKLGSNLYGIGKCFPLAYRFTDMMDQFICFFNVDGFSDY